MDPKSETKQPVQVEKKVQALKAKAKEIVKKAIPEKTRQWLLKAGKQLQQKEGRKAIEILSGPPPTTLEAGNLHSEEVVKKSSKKLSEATEKLETGDSKQALEILADLDVAEVDEVTHRKVEQTLPDQKAWEVIEKAAAVASKESSGSRDEERQVKPRSMMDKVHRQVLLMQARREGVKDLGRFQELTDYLESTVYEYESKHVKVPKGLTDEQRNKIIEDWKAKGWRGDIQEYPGDKQASLSLNRHVPLRLEREHIKLMKGLISADNNPVEIAEGLKKMGFWFSEYVLKSPDKMEKLSELFTAPHAKEALELAHGVSQWSSDWFSNEGSSYEPPVEVGQIEFLTQLAQSPDPKTAFPPELVQKVDTLSRALYMKVGTTEITHLQTIINNPDYMEFVAYLANIDCLKSSYSQKYPFLKNIVDLDNAGLLKPIVDLYHSGVSVEAFGGYHYSSNTSLWKLFNSDEAYYSSPEDKQKVVEHLQGVLTQPEVQSFLKDTQRQEFVREMGNLSGTPLFVGELSDLDNQFGEGIARGKEAISVLKSLQESQKDDASRYMPGLDNLGSITANPRLMATFTDKDFPKFMEALISKTDYRLNNFDLFYNGSSKIAEVFNNPVARQGLVQDSTIEIIKAIGGGINLYNPEYYIRLGNNPNMVPTINALRNIGYKSSGSSYDVPAETLEAIANNPEALSKFESPELKSLAARLVQEFKWEARSSNINNLIELHDNKELQQQLFNPENSDYIKKIQLNGLSLSDVKPMLDLDPVRRDLMMNLVGQFNYYPEFSSSLSYGRGKEQQKMLDKLVQNDDLRTKLFSEHTQEVFKRLHEDFNYYSLQMNDIETIMNAPSDFPDFFGELKEKYKYSFQNQDLIPLLQLAANKEGFNGLLDTLVNHGYQFKTKDITYISQLMPQAEKLPALLTTINKVNIQYVFNVQDIPYLLQLEPVIDRLPDTVAVLSEVIGYKFNIHDSQQLAFVVEGGYTKERLIGLKQIYDKYMDRKFNIVAIQTAAFIEDHKDTLTLLESSDSKTITFFASRNEIFNQLVTPQGKLTATFLEELAKSNNSSMNPIDFYLKQTNWLSLAPQEAPFWDFIKEKSPDFQRFLLQKPRDLYFKEGQLLKEKMQRDFITEVIATPEKCTTYESLTDVFNSLKNYSNGFDLGMIYLKIAEAHRLRGAFTRTEVETLVSLRQAVASLYHSDMTPFEKMSWKILQRQLPFTSNEEMRTEMREKALDVEALDNALLSWVHESVHNYASTYEVSYLKTFREYLTTGNKEKLEYYRKMYSDPGSRSAQAPDYSESDRQKLLAIPNLLTELDKQIDLTSQFYEIRPETLEINANMILSEFTEKNLLTQLVEDIKKLKTTTAIGDSEDKTAVVHFLLNVNKVRETILNTLNTGSPANRNKTGYLVLDAILDDFSQKLFTMYKDYLEGEKDTLPTKEPLEASAILGELLKAGQFNGEIPDEILSKANEMTNNYYYPEQATKENLYSLNLWLPIISNNISNYWQRFSQLAIPEMTAMLVRTGLSEEEAVERIIFTDLVEFKKSSTTFNVEPMMPIVEAGLEKISPSDINSAFFTQIERLRDNNLVEGDRNNPEIAKFLENLEKNNTPSALQEEFDLLIKLGTSQEAKADKLAIAVTSDYLNKDRLTRNNVLIEKNDKKIEIYPVTYFGVDMAVILVNGKRVENPKEVLLENFSVPKVVLDSLKEGD